MKKFILIISLFVLAIGLDSCKTGDLELTNPNGIPAGNFPNTSAELVAGLNAVYAPLQSFGLYGRYLPFLLDNMVENTGRAALSGDLRAFTEMTFKPENGDILLYWKNCYAGISRANLLLDNLDKIEQIKDATPETKATYVGEVKFLRAHYYFLLVSRFGDIPLYTTNAPAINDGTGFKRSPKEDVYQLIIADLQDAASKLREKSAEDNGRATIGAANSLLGKVHLYRKEYAEAKAAFDKVIASGEYSLTANYFDNFTIEAEHNSESIFEIEFDLEAQGGNAWAANWGGGDDGQQELSARSREYGFLGWHNVNPTDALVDAFEANDPRLHETVFLVGDLYGASNTAITQDQIGDEKSAWRKYEIAYKSDGEGGLSEINHRAIRYADVLLMAAEAENELGNMAEAISLMNQTRTRVGIDNYGTAAMNATYPVTTKDEVFAALVHERQVELAGEQTRFPDLVRWGMAGDNIPNFVVGKHEIFPIPQGEIDTNINLSNEDQNPNY